MDSIGNRPGACKKGLDSLRCIDTSDAAKAEYKLSAVLQVLTGLASHLASSWHAYTLSTSGTCLPQDVAQSLQLSQPHAAADWQHA